MEVKKENEKVGLKLNIHTTKVMASGSHHFMANRWENSDRIYFFGGGSEITAEGDCRHEIKRYFLDEKL